MDPSNMQRKLIFPACKQEISNDGGAGGGWRSYFPAAIPTTNIKEDVKNWHSEEKAATCGVSLTAASRHLFTDTDSQKFKGKNSNDCEVTSGWGRASSRFASQSCEVKNQMTQFSRPRIHKEVQKVARVKMSGLWRGEETKGRWAAHSCDTSLRSIRSPNSRRRTSSTSESSGLRVHTGWGDTWGHKKTFTHNPDFHYGPFFQKANHLFGLWNLRGWDD